MGIPTHGLMTVMLAALKGVSSRVATLNRQDAAIAAIWAFATTIEWPCRLARVTGMGFPVAATYPINTGIAPENAPTKVHISVRRLRGV